jgi:hypothetical protein
LILRSKVWIYENNNIPAATIVIATCQVPVHSCGYWVGWKYLRLFHQIYFCPIPERQRSWLMTKCSRM